MVFFFFLNTISGLPGKSRACNRYLNPNRWIKRRTFNSGFVSLLRTRDMRSLLSEGLRVSGINEASLFNSQSLELNRDIGAMIRKNLVLILGGKVASVLSPGCRNLDLDFDAAVLCAAVGRVIGGDRAGVGIANGGNAPPVQVRMAQEPVNHRDSAGRR